MFSTEVAELESLIMLDSEQQELAKHNLTVNMVETAPSDSEYAEEEEEEEESNIKDRNEENKDENEEEEYNEDRKNIQTEDLRIDLDDAKTPPSHPILEKKQTNPPQSPAPKPPTNSPPKAPSSPTISRRETPKVQAPAPPRFPSTTLLLDIDENDGSLMSKPRFHDYTHLSCCLIFFFSWTALAMFS